MNSSQIEHYLGVLGQKLADMQIKASIILLGGALMVTQIGNRKATQDIDVVIATNDRHTYEAVQQAIALVAKEKNLPDDRDILALAQRLVLSTKTQAWSIVNRYIPDTQFRLRSEYTTQAINRCFPK